MRHHATYKKPLLGKVIYIDLTSNFHGLHNLQEKLRLLGAELESCFSKEVDYLITNKEYAKPANLCTSPSNTSPGGTPSPFGLAKGSVESPRDQSPAAGESRASSERLSRGQKLLNARRKKTYASIVENAIKWKIKIISYEGALKYIERELKNMPDSVKHAASTKSKTYDKRKKKVNLLKGSYLKFEAASRHYRPVHQEFTEMPELHFNSRSCPFDKTKAGQVENIQHLTQEEGERAERGNEKDLLDGTPGESRNSKASEPKPQDKGKKLVRKTSLEFPGHSAKHYRPAELRKIMREKAQVEAKKGYCEICRVQYDDIKKHQWNAQHREFVTNAENFSGLDSMIESGPNFEQFLRDVVKYHQEHVKEGLAESEMDDEVLLIKEGLPGSSEQSNQMSKTTPPSTGSRKSKVSPKKRLFSESTEENQKARDGRNKSPMEPTSLRRKVIPKRVRHLPKNNRNLLDGNTNRKNDSGTPNQSRLLSCLPVKSSYVSKPLPRQLKTSPRKLQPLNRQSKASPRLPRQSPRTQELNKSVPSQKDCSSKTHHRESSAKRSKLSPKNCGNDEIMNAQSCDNDNNYEVDASPGCSTRAKNVQTQEDSGDVTLRNINKKDRQKNVQTVVNTVQIEQTVTPTLNPYNNGDCDIQLGGKSRQNGGNHEKDKKVTSRQCRRRDMTPPGTDFQDSGINVSNSSPVKDTQESGRTQEDPHRKSSRKSRSRLYNKMNAQPVEMEGNSKNENINGEGKDKELDEGESGNASSKRRKSCPVFSAKRRLIVCDGENDEQYGKSSVERRLREDEKHISDGQCVQRFPPVTVVIENLGDYQSNQETGKAQDMPRNVSELAPNSKGKSRTPGSKENKGKLCRNDDKEKASVGKSKHDKDTEEINKVTKEKPVEIVVENVETVVEHSKNSPSKVRTKITKLRLLRKDGVKCVDGGGKDIDYDKPVEDAISQQHDNDNLNKYAKPRKDNTVHEQGKSAGKFNGGAENIVHGQQKENIEKENNITDGTVALCSSPTKKFVRLSDEVARRGKLKDQQSPEAKEALKRKRKIKKKLRESWQVLSDRSMRKVLESEGDQEFEGYTAESFHEPQLPFDVSYIDLTEVEYSDNSEVDWIFGEAEESRSPKHLPPIQNFLKKHELPADRASSQWNEPVDCYVSSHVQEEQTKRMTRSSLQKTPVKDPSQDLNHHGTDPKVNERTMEKTVVEETKGNPKHMLQRVFSRYLSGGSLEPLWVDSSEPSENAESYANLGLPVAEMDDKEDVSNNNIAIQCGSGPDVSNYKLSRHHRKDANLAKSPGKNAINKSNASRMLCKKNTNPRPLVRQQSSLEMDPTSSLIVNPSLCGSPPVLSPEIRFTGKRDVFTLGNCNISDTLSPEIPFIGKDDTVVVARASDRPRSGTLKRLTDMQVTEFGGVMHSTPLHGTADNGRKSTVELNKTPHGIQALNKQNVPQRQISIAISDTTVEINPRFSRRSLASIFELNANKEGTRTQSSRKQKKGPRSIASVQSVESVSPWKVTNDMDGQIEIDEDIIFNYNSPQKLRRDFSPLKDKDVAYLRNLNSSLSNTDNNPEHSRTFPVRNLSGVLLSQAGLQIDTILSKSKNTSQDNESDKSVEIPYIGGNKKILQSPVVEEIKSKAMYKFDYMSSSRRNKAKENQRKWYNERVNRSRKLLSGSTKNKENCIPNPEPRLLRVRSEKTEQRKRERSPSPNKKKKKTEDDSSSKTGSEFRVNIMVKKFGKQGCLCHEHKPGSRCPNAKESKKLPSSPDYRRQSPVKRNTKKSPMKRTRSNSPSKPLSQNIAKKSPIRSSLRRNRSPIKSEGKKLVEMGDNRRNFVVHNEKKRSTSSSPYKKSPFKDRSRSAVVNLSRTVSPSYRQRHGVSKRSRSISAGKSPPRKRTREDMGSLSHEHYINRRLLINSPPSRLMRKNRLRSGAEGSRKSSELSHETTGHKCNKSSQKVLISKSEQKRKPTNSGSSSITPKSTRTQNVSLKEMENQNKKSASSNFMLQRLNLQLSDAEICASFIPLKTRSVSSISSEELALQLAEFKQTTDNKEATSLEQNQEEKSNINTLSLEKASCCNSSENVIRTDSIHRHMRSGGQSRGTNKSVELSRSCELGEESNEMPTLSSKPSGLRSRRKLFSLPLKERPKSLVTVALKPLSPSVTTRLKTQGHIVT